MENELLSEELLGNIFFIQILLLLLIEAKGLGLGCSKSKICMYKGKRKLHFEES